MVKPRPSTWVILAMAFLVACGGEPQSTTNEQSGGGDAAPAALPVNTGTVSCDVFAADDLAVESCYRVVNTWLIVLRKRPYAVTIGLPSIDPGTYSADRGGQGLAITLTDATNLDDIQHYGIKELRVDLESKDGVRTGTYEGVVLKDYVKEIPIRGKFRFDESKVGE